MYDSIGASQRGAICGGFQDVGAFPGHRLGPQGRFCGGGDRGPGWFAGAAEGTIRQHSELKFECRPYLIEMTSHPLAVAALHIREPA